MAVNVLCLFLVDPIVGLHAHLLLDKNVTTANQMGHMFGIRSESSSTLMFYVCERPCRYDLAFWKFRHNSRISSRLRCI